MLKWLVASVNTFLSYRW